MPARARAEKDKRHPSLPYVELPLFLDELRQRSGITPKALEFAILTAARTGEVIGATWAEIDVEAREWRIPAKRMKGRQRASRGTIRARPGNPGAHPARG